MTKPIPTYRIRLVFFSLIVFCSVIARSQTTDPQSSYLNWFDQQVGIENTALYKGIIYKETYRTINEKVKFYKTAEWYTGSVVYSGQLFTDVLLKYDVFGDQLLVKQLDRLGGGSILLFKDKVDEFAIDGTQFVHVHGSSQIDGYYELLWDEDGNRLLGKHLKNDFLRKDRRATYYEFTDLKKEYVLDKQGSYYSIKGKKELTNIYPGLKREINSFYQKNKGLRSRDMDAFMVAIINVLEEATLTGLTETGQ